ncbi:MAG: hypothetical protein ABSA12_02880 [Verrucomicrobiia bacterium]|jgi:hypothetical protein
MEDSDYDEVEELFNEDPSAFDFRPPEIKWQPPSHLLFAVPLRFPLDAGGDVWHEDALVFPVDMFASQEIGEQLWERFRESRRSDQSPFRHEWGTKLYDQYEKLRLEIPKIPMLFQPPLKYVQRSDFSEAGLATVLGMRPELFDVYVANGVGSHRFRYCLRIHSSLKVPQTGFLWFEKRIPDGIGPDETYSWFEALIGKLPKRCRPHNIENWLSKLAEYDSHLVKQEPKQAKNWMDRSEIVIVCGPESNPSGAHRYHLCREEFRSFRREGHVLEFSSERDESFQSERRISRSRFIILCRDATAAESTERSMHAGTKIYFGLGQAITGIMHLSDDSVVAVGVDESVIKEYCCRNGEELESTPSRRRRKLYWIRRKG